MGVAVEVEDEDEEYEDEDEDEDEEEGSWIVVVSDGREGAIYVEEGKAFGSEDVAEGDDKVETEGGGRFEATE